MTRRFVGTGVALGLLVAALAIRSWPDDVPPAERAPLVSFEPSQVLRVEIVRGADELTLVRGDRGWRMKGRRWQPRRRVVRRILHQLHDVRPRRVVAESPTDELGLGPEAPMVTIVVQDGTVHRLRIGASNPAGVSHYVQRLPEPRVYLVASAAAEMFHWSEGAFREDRVTAVEHDEVVRFEAQLAGQYVDVERVGDDWVVRRTEPRRELTAEAAALLLGRLTGLRSRAVLADEPPDLTPWRLQPGADHATVWSASGVLWAAAFAGADPCLMYLEPDRAVYEVSCGARDAFSSLGGASAPENDRGND